MSDASTVSLLAQGVLAVTPASLVMIAVAGLLLWLGIAKNYEPLLLLPIGAGCLLANLPLSPLIGEEGMLRALYHMGVGNEMFPLLIFIGIGALTDFGPLLENFVLGELARQLGWAQTRATLHHYRTRDGVEVDAVLEAADGRIVGIEVKAAETVRAEDFRGLRHLQARVPDRFHHGLVLYTGDKALAFGDRLLAAPISALWNTEG